MKYLFLTIALFFGLLELQAQTYSLKGTVLEAGKSGPIPYANILLLRASDSTQVAGTISKGDGQFEINSIKEGVYLFKIQFLGYQVLYRTLDIQSDTQLGILSLREEEQALSEVVVAASRATGTQKRDLWASWCGPCRAEMPHISDLYDAVKDTLDLEFLMIGLDENKQKSQEFMEGKSWSFPVVHASYGLNNSLQSESIPTTLVVNKEGKIVFYHQGMSNFNTEEFRTFLRSQ